MSGKLKQAIDVWCTTYPRRVTSQQRWCTNPLGVAKEIMKINGSQTVAPFVSVYGFPNGHPKHGHIPDIDCIFIDFDIPAGGEYRSSDPDPEAWYRDMSALLTRVREVCRLLIKENSADNFRAALSGHKGVHIFLDFNSIDANEGTPQQFKNGLKRYAEDLIEYLENKTHLDMEAWVDVDSSDLSRLCRLPNTKHVGASNAFDEDRYCVPVSIRELANITPNEYMKLTRQPRDVPEDCQRSLNGRATQIITQYIRKSSGSTYRGVSSYDPRALDKYESEIQNENIELSDIPFLTGQKPCIWAFRERSDMFDHGAASHAMELNVISHLVEESVPIDVIVEFFNTADNFNEEFTRSQVDKVIAHKLNPYRCDTIWQQAPMFCLGDVCDLYEKYKGTPASN